MSQKNSNRGVIPPFLFVPWLSFNFAPHPIFPLNPEESEDSCISVLGGPLGLRPRQTPAFTVCLVIFLISVCLALWPLKDAHYPLEISTVPVPLSGHCPKHQRISMVSRYVYWRGTVVTYDPPFEGHLVYEGCS